MIGYSLFNSSAVLHCDASFFFRSRTVRSGHTNGHEHAHKLARGELVRICCASLPWQPTITRLRGCGVLCAVCVHCPCIRQGKVAPVLCACSVNYAPQVRNGTVICQRYEKYINEYSNRSKKRQKLNLNFIYFILHSARDGKLNVGHSNSAILVYC